MREPKDDDTYFDRQQDEEPKGKEVLFKQDELINIKGCNFRLLNIFPNPENTLWFLAKTLLKC